MIITIQISLGTFVINLYSVDNQNNHNNQYKFMFSIHAYVSDSEK